MKKLLILFLFLSSCLSQEDKAIHSKGIIAGFYEQKNASGVVTKYTSVQDTSGKIFSVLRKKCTDCLLNDSVKLVYYNNSLIEDSGDDKYEVDSCVKFSRPSWKAEKIVVKYISLDSLGRNFKEIDTTYFFK